MNSKERLDAFVKGLPVDRKPNLTIVGGVVTQYNGINLETYCKDPAKMVEGAVACARDTGLDFVQIASDLLREAEGFGTQVLFEKDKMPTAIKYALSDIEDVKNLKPYKAKDVKRVWDLVEATKLALELEKDINPMTLIVGPASVAGNVRGVESFLVDCYDEPELCTQLLDIVTETIINIVEELAAAGSKYIYLADPVASLFAPELYAELILPCHKKIYGRMAELGIVGRLHMCGNTQSIIPYSSTSGATIIDIDHAVDAVKALEDAQGRCILNGNIDPVEDVYSCDADHAYASIIALSNKCGVTNKMMFMPGCELPADTNVENVKAITKALADIG